MCLEIAMLSEIGTIVASISNDFFEKYGYELTSSFDTVEITIFQENGIVIFDSVNNLHLIRYKSGEHSQKQIVIQLKILSN